MKIFEGWWKQLSVALYVVNSSKFYCILHIILLIARRLDAEILMLLAQLDCPSSRMGNSSYPRVSCNALTDYNRAGTSVNDNNTVVFHVHQRITYAHGAPIYAWIFKAGTLPVA